MSKYLRYARRREHDVTSRQPSLNVTVTNDIDSNRPSFDY